jgi:hypothetical protein
LPLYGNYPSIEINNPLVIEKTSHLFDLRIVEREWLHMPFVKPAIYFLNRIVLPLGKSLKSNFEPKIQFEEDRATITGNGKLDLAEDALWISVHDLMMRMVQSGRLLITLAKGQELTLHMAARNSDKQLLKQCFDASLQNAKPPGYKMNFNYEGSFAQQTAERGRAYVSLKADHFHLSLEPLHPPRPSSDRYTQRGAPAMVYCRHCHFS